MLTVTRNNIFTSECQVLVNPVNCVGVMGSGLALSFKQKFPDMYNRYQLACSNNQLKVGKLLLYKRSEPWILCFPTKDHWKNPSEYKYLSDGLRKFRATYESKGIQSIAFPLLGTGLGKLDIEKVLIIMRDYLEDLPIKVEIRHHKYNLKKFAKDVGIARIS